MGHWCLVLGAWSLVMQPPLTLFPCGPYTCAQSDVTPDDDTSRPRMASMKAERRHELKHNELADWIGELTQGLKPHATGVLIGLVVLAAIVLGSIWYFSGETAAASRSWSQYFYAFSERDP